MHSAVGESAGGRALCSGWSGPGRAPSAMVHCLDLPARPFPFERRDARIGRKGGAVKADLDNWKFAQRVNSGWTQLQTPGAAFKAAAFQRARLRKGGAIEHGEIFFPLRIAHGLIADQGDR